MSQLQVTVLAALLGGWLPSLVTSFNAVLDDQFISPVDASRLFSFNQDQTRLRVELAFNIPFVSIPVTGRRANESLVDINLGALGAGAIFSLASIIFIPQIFDGFKPEFSFDSVQGRSNRMSSTWSKVDATLKEKNMDARACAQRAVCSLVATSFNNIRRGQAGSVDKIVEGVVSNEWLVRSLRSLSIHDAINNGRQGGNCSSLYESCSLSEKQLKNLGRNLLKNIPR